MRWLLILLLWAGCAHAQTRDVHPGELSLSVSVMGTSHVPYEREMVMILIRGVYTRHITREKLEQPALEGFSWTQLGPDNWYEERQNGQKVKVLERRMALYPETAGTLTIGAFTHHLTLTDERDNWFEHEITSEPLTVEVAPAPLAPGDWWFPALQLHVSDDWSNAPDQLKPGEGVLRVIKLEALGVTPEMIPPMPELTSPSAMIYAHPEKRLVELSPEGPLTYAFWRWTIQPTNDRSAIVEPIRFNYYDTRNRVMRAVTISAQRVAYDAQGLPPVAAPSQPARLPGAGLALLAVVAALGLTGWAVRGRQGDLAQLYRRVPLLDPLARRLRRAARADDLSGTRRAARALLMRDGTGGRAAGVLDGFDRAVFDGKRSRPDTRAFARAFLKARRTGGLKT